MRAGGERSKYSEDYSAAGARIDVSSRGHTLSTISRTGWNRSVLANLSRGLQITSRIGWIDTTVVRRFGERHEARKICWRKVPTKLSPGKPKTAKDEGEVRSPLPGRLILFTTMRSRKCSATSKMTHRPKPGITFSPGGNRRHTSTIARAQNDPVLRHYFQIRYNRSAATAAGQAQMSPGHVH